MFFWRKGIFFERKHEYQSRSLWVYSWWNFLRAFIPQIVKIFKEKSAEEISLLTCIIGIISSVLWLYYGVVKTAFL